MKFENETITLYEEVLKCYEKLIALETKIENLQKELEINYDDRKS